jgi:hypothetical protein
MSLAHKIGKPATSEHRLIRNYFCKVLLCFCRYLTFGYMCVISVWLLPNENVTVFLMFYYYFSMRVLYNFISQHVFSLFVFTMLCPHRGACYLPLMQLDINFDISCWSLYISLSVYSNVLIILIIVFLVLSTEILGYG